MKYHFIKIEKEPKNVVPNHFFKHLIETIQW